jgi:hypothetical protein
MDSECNCVRPGLPALRVRGRRIPLWAVALFTVALSVAAYFPYLDTGFAGDDFIFISMMEGATPYDPVKGLWHGSIESYPAFSSAWWLEHGAQAAFLRPVPSWALIGLYKAFGRNAVPYHLASMIIHGLAAFTLFLVLRRLSRRNGVPLLAALMFLICEDHGMTVAWIATITDLMCVLFLNTALLCHVVARQEGRPWCFALSLLFALAAMASKETAVVYPAVVMAYELLLQGREGPAPEPPGRGARFRRLGREWWAWAVPALAFAGYLALYLRVVPPMRNLMYQDPLTDPVRYAAAALQNLPVMFAGLLTQLLPSVVTFVPGTKLFVVGGGAILTALLIRVLLPYGKERPLWFALAAFVIGLLPGLATDPGERLLYFPSAYGMFVVAWLVARVPPLARRFAPGAAPRALFLERLWAWYLLFAGAVVPAVLLFTYPPMWIEGLKMPERTVTRSIPLIEDGRSKHVVYLNTNSSFNTFYLKDIYRYYRGRYMDVRLLSSFNGRVWAKRESECTLALRTEDEGWLSNMFARVLRVTPKIEAGLVRRNDLFTATVVSATPDGLDAAEVRFEFNVSLDDPSLALLCYDGREYRRWRPAREWRLLNPVLDEYGL